MLNHNFKINREHILEGFLTAALELIGFDTLEDAMNELGFDIRVGDEADVFALDSNGLGYASPKEDEILQAIAPFVEPGSYINMVWEGSEVFQWFFDGRKCHSRNIRLVGQPVKEDDLKAFYTDLGESPQIVDAAGNDWYLNRYGVWMQPYPGAKFEVVETFDDLMDLIDAWGELPLFKIEPVVKP